MDFLKTMLRQVMVVKHEKRAIELGDELQIQSDTNKGTTVMFKINE